MDLSNQRIVIIGAGVAGLGAAYALLNRGARNIVVLEREPLSFSQASGHNAAIFRPLERDPLIARLAAKSLNILQRLQKVHPHPLIAHHGLIMLASDEPELIAELSAMRENAHQNGLHAQYINPSQMSAIYSHIPLHHTGHALWSKDGGVMDPHGIAQALTSSCKKRGAIVRHNTSVMRLQQSEDGRCEGVVIEGGEHVAADCVILCAGAATGPLALGVNATLPLVPLQRHLAVLENVFKVGTRAPAIWQLSPELYFRPEGDGLLVSPCDETPNSTGRPQKDVSALSPLYDRLAKLTPAAADAHVRTAWACIRTKAVDGRPIVGADPKVQGLYYLTGLGGFGMSCGLASADVLAQSMMEQRTPACVSPRRFHLPDAHASADYCVEDFPL